MNRILNKSNVTLSRADIDRIKQVSFERYNCNNDALNNAEIGEELNFNSFTYNHYKGQYNVADLLLTKTSKETWTLENA